MTETPAQGKGRPTPKRPKRGTGPVAPPPANRREAAKRMREQAADQRKKIKTGTKTGDTRYLMPRDAGPVRQLVRDLVDSRRHIGVLLLPAALLPVLAQLAHNAQVLALATTLWLATLLAAISDFVITTFVVRGRIKADHPDETKMRGHLLYAVVRTAQFRRFRLPPPRVVVGEKV
ncbi:MAG: hypothetical protein JWN77_2303 [Frankiales bacterium]|nr:hypothetical protein [Frankiales bacterium]